MTRIAKATFNKKNNVSGEVLFEEVKKGVKVTYDFKGLKNGKHGFHGHEKGNFNGDCNKFMNNSFIFPIYIITSTIYF